MSGQHLRNQASTKNPKTHIFISDSAKGDRRRTPLWAWVSPSSLMNSAEDPCPGAQTRVTAMTSHRYPLLRLIPAVLALKTNMKPLPRANTFSCFLDVISTLEMKFGHTPEKRSHGAIRPNRLGGSCKCVPWGGPGGHQTTSTHGHGWTSPSFQHHHFRCCSCLAW